MKSIMSYATKKMGDDFISPNKISEIYKEKYTKGDLRKLVDTLPSKEIIDYLHEKNFILIASPWKTMNCNDVVRINYSNIFPICRFYENNFLKETIESAFWIAIQKAVTNSALYFEHFLSEEKIPSATEALWAFSVYAEINGTERKESYFFEPFLTSTIDVDDEGKKNEVVIFQSNGKIAFGNTLDFIDRKNKIGLLLKQPLKRPSI